jgi:hypothetical protein
LICFLGASLRRGGGAVETLSLENNGIRRFDALARIKTYLPDLRTLKIAGNPIDDAGQIERLARSTGIEILTEEANDSALSSSRESSEASDSAGSTDEEDSPGRAEELSHAVVWTSARPADPHPVPAPMPAKDPRIRCVRPFLDLFVETSAAAIADTAAFYTDDACFSLCFGKIGGEWAHLFPSNRNLAMRRGNETSQVVGPIQIGEKLSTLFPDGLGLQAVTAQVAVVCDLFYSVAMYGTASISGKSLAMMRSLVIVGHNRHLFIANDVLSLRYDQGPRSRPRAS